MTTPSPNFGCTTARPASVSMSPAGASTSVGGAVVAVVAPAAALRVLLAEVAQQHPPPAVGGFGVEAHPLHPGDDHLAAALRVVDRLLDRGVGVDLGPVQHAVLVGDDGARLLEQVQRGRGADPRQAARPHDVGQGAGPVRDRFERGAEAVRLRSSRAQEALQGAVAGVVVQLDDRGLAVPPRPSDLLVVVVERARRGGVEHEPHVGLVDAHAEGRGGDDDGGRARAEPVVHRLAPGPTEARVVGLRRDPAAAQRLGEAAGLGARGAVDQAPAPVLLGEGGGAVDHRAAPLVLVDVQLRRQVQVGPVERPDHLDGVVEPQPVEHVGAHRRRGGRGEGQHRRLAQLGDHVTEAQVVRSEVVAPLRDAVRLVDHEQPDGRVPEPFDHVGARELLGSEEHVRGAAFVHDLPRLPVLLGPLHRVDHHRLRRVLAVGALGDAGALVALQRHQAARRSGSAPPAAPPEPGRSPTCPRRWAAPPARPGPAATASIAVSCSGRSSCHPNVSAATRCRSRVVALTATLYPARAGKTHPVW